MDWTAAHAGFVTAAYIISGASIVGLIAFVFRRDARARRALTQSERGDRG